MPSLQESAIENLFVELREQMIVPRTVGNLGKGHVSENLGRESSVLQVHAHRAKELQFASEACCLPFEASTTTTYVPLVNLILLK